MTFNLRIRLAHHLGVTVFDCVEDQHDNITPMWQRAFRIPNGEDTSWFDGKTCAEMQEAAIEALRDCWTNREAYIALAPPVHNWGGPDRGNYLDFLQTGLIPFADEVHRFPTGTIVWSA